MDTASFLNSYILEERFPKALKLIRTALGSMEVAVVGELDITEKPHPGASSLSRSTILLVDCPLLDLEALALDRAAAVFLPLHVLVSAAGEQTKVSVVNPTGIFNARFPAGSVGPLDRLVSRVGMALESLVQQHA